VAEQTYRIAAAASDECDRGETANRPHVARVSPKNILEYESSRLSILRRQRGSRLLDAIKVRVCEPCSLVRHSGVPISSNIDENVAVSEPRGLEFGRGGYYALEFSQGLRGLSGGAERAREVDARLPEARVCGDRALQELDRSGYPILIEKRDAEKVQALDMAWGGRLNGTKLPLRTNGMPGTQCDPRFRIRHAQRCL
jgi:hypothetical protein